MNCLKIGYKTEEGGIKKIVDSNLMRTLTVEKKFELQFRGLDIDKDRRWNAKKINAEMLQAIESGEDISKMSERLQRVTDMNKVSAVRNARTMTTSFENKGRLDGMDAMQADGTIVKKQWLATHDSKTRDAHAELNGETAEIHEPFKNEIGEIYYPGDPNAVAANVYNCRCTLIFSVEGFEPTLPKGTVKVIDNEVAEIHNIKPTGEITTVKWMKGSGATPIDLSESPLKYSEDVLLPDKVYKNVKKFEDEYYLYVDEYAAIYDKNGNMVKLIKGETGLTRVKMSDINKGYVFTHTHGRNKGDDIYLIGGTFSYGDMDVFVDSDVKMMRAAGKEGTYFILKKSNFNGEEFKKYYKSRVHEIENTTKEALKKQEEILRKQEKIMDKRKAQEIYYNAWVDEENRKLVNLHNALLEGADKYGYEYMLEKRETVK